MCVAGLVYSARERRWAMAGLSCRHGDMSVDEVLLNVEVLWWREHDTVHMTNQAQRHKDCIAIVYATMRLRTHRWAFAPLQRHGWRIEDSALQPAYGTRKLCPWLNSPDPSTRHGTLLDCHPGNGAELGAQIRAKDGCVRNKATHASIDNRNLARWSDNEHGEWREVMAYNSGTSAGQFPICDVKRNSWQSMSRSGPYTCHGVLLNLRAVRGMHDEVNPSTQVEHVVKVDTLVLFR